jgi:hypothetical protein
VISGRCLCGVVQFCITPPFEYSGYCHCSRCRMASGSAFVAFAGTPRENVRVTEGTDSVETYRRNADVVSHFCRHCSSVLFLIVRDESYAHVQLGALVTDPGIRPQFHMYVASKAAWHHITDSLPQFAELPP